MIMSFFKKTTKQTGAKAKQTTKKTTHKPSTPAQAKSSSKTTLLETAMKARSKIPESKKILTFEGWRRLMMKKSKRTKKS